MKGTVLYGNCWLVAATEGSVLWGPGDDATAADAGELDTIDMIDDDDDDKEDEGKDADESLTSNQESRRGSKSCEATSEKESEKRGAAVSKTRRKKQKETIPRINTRSVCVDASQC
jgi:hypothetical protein